MHIHTHLTVSQTATTTTTTTVTTTSATTTTTTTTAISRKSALVLCHLSVSMASGQPMSAAQRRKERRLRSWWLHEQQSIAMPWQLRRTTACSRKALCRARGQPPGLRRQTESPPEARPGILAEPGPQRSDRSLRHSSGKCLPRLATSSLAGATGEVVDSSSFGFLAAFALKRKEEEEERKRLLRRTAEASEEANRSLAFVREVAKRKRKKRKKRLPQTSSFARPARPWKSGHYSAGPCPGTSCSVSASCLRRTRIICFPRGRIQDVLPYCARCLVRQWLPVHASITEVAGIFPVFLRPGGPRILRSILCRLRITGFLDSLGNDFKNMLA